MYVRAADQASPATIRRFIQYRRQPSRNLPCVNVRSYIFCKTHGCASNKNRTRAEGRSFFVLFLTYDARRGLGYVWSAARTDLVFGCGFLYRLVMRCWRKSFLSDEPKTTETLHTVDDWAFKTRLWILKSDNFRFLKSHIDAMQHRTWWPRLQASLPYGTECSCPCLRHCAYNTKVLVCSATCRLEHTLCSFVCCWHNCHIEGSSPKSALVLSGMSRRKHTEREMIGRFIELKYKGSASECFNCVRWFATLQCLLYVPCDPFVFNAVCFVLFWLFSSAYKTARASKPLSPYWLCTCGSNSVY